MTKLVQCLYIYANTFWKFSGFFYKEGLTLVTKTPIFKPET